MLKQVSQAVDIMNGTVSDSCFPSVTIAFKIYLTIPCSSCEGKRYISKLFHDKTERTLSEYVCLEMSLLRK